MIVRIIIVIIIIRTWAAVQKELDEQVPGVVYYSPEAETQCFPRAGKPNNGVHHSSGADTNEQQQTKNKFVHFEDANNLTPPVI